MAIWQVFRDGNPIAGEFASFNDASVWLMKHRPFSTDHLVRHEGYTFELPELGNVQSMIPADFGQARCTVEGRICGENEAMRTINSAGFWINGKTAAAHAYCMESWLASDAARTGVN